MKGFFPGKKFNEMKMKTNIEKIIFSHLHFKNCFSLICSGMVLRLFTLVSIAIPCVNIDTEFSVFRSLAQVLPVELHYLMHSSYTCKLF